MVKPERGFPTYASTPKRRSDMENKLQILIVHMQPDHEEYDKEAFNLESDCDLHHLRRRLKDILKDGDKCEISMNEMTREEWSEIQRISLELA